MENDLRTLLLAYMYTNVPEETKVLINKLAFAHENNQSNKKSKKGDAWIKFKQREKNPSIFQCCLTCKIDELERFKTFSENK